MIFECSECGKTYWTPWQRNDCEAKCLEKILYFERERARLNQECKDLAAKEQKTLAATPKPRTYPKPSAPRTTFKPVHRPHFATPKVVAEEPTTPLIGLNSQGHVTLNVGGFSVDTADGSLGVNVGNTGFSVDLGPSTTSGSSFSFGGGDSGGGGASDSYCGSSDSSSSCGVD